MLGVISFIWRYKTVALLIAAGLYLGYYKIQFSRYKSKYEEERMRVEALTDSLDTLKNRQKALHELEKKQREEDEEIQERIRSRTYFGNN